MPTIKAFQTVDAIEPTIRMLQNVPIQFSDYLILQKFQAQLVSKQK